MVISVFVLPDLRRTAEKAARIVARLRPDLVLLNLPRNMNDLIARLAGTESLDDFKEDIRRYRLMPEPLDAWMYSFEPLLRMIGEAGEMLRVSCYCDSDFYLSDQALAVTLAQQTLRDSVRGRVEVQRWRDLIEEGLRLWSKAIGLDASFILHEARNCPEAICISSLEGPRIEELLSQECETTLEYLESPYFFTPLQQVEIEMAAGDVEDERIERLIRCHIQYVHEFVLRSESRDEAYSAWSRAVIERFIGPKLFSPS
ncbi:MAG: hypothetical protein ACETV0_00280 [Nitrososphaeria archaeon]